MQPFRK